MTVNSSIPVWNDSVALVYCRVGPLLQKSARQGEVGEEEWRNGTVWAAVATGGASD